MSELWHPRVIIPKSWIFPSSFWDIAVGFFLVQRHICHLFALTGNWSSHSRNFTEQVLDNSDSFTHLSLATHLTLQNWKREKAAPISTPSSLLAWISWLTALTKQSSPRRDRASLLQFNPRHTRVSLSKDQIKLSRTCYHIRPP